MNNSVLLWLEESAKRMPDKPAIIDVNGSISFSQYKEKAEAIGRSILELSKGLTKIPVAVFLEKGKEVVVSFLGVACCGSFYTPIDVDMPIPRVKKILEVLNPQIIITTNVLKPLIADFGYYGETIIYEEVIPKYDDQKVIQNIADKIIDTDLLYVLFTSGSTGIPKGVSICHRSVIDYIDWVSETFEITEEDSFGNQAPFYFDNSILDIYTSLKTGATLYIIPPKLFFQPVSLLEFIKNNNISTIFWVPSALIVVAKLKALSKIDLSDTLKRVLFCGEVMPNKQLNIWRTYLPNAIYANLYGPTEITDACTYYIVNRCFSDDEPLPIGIPMRNTDIMILNDQNELIHENDTESIGELCVRGTSLALGYYNNPQKTVEVFVQNPFNNAIPEKIYRTGDLVKYNEFGEIMYLSRKDFQIKHKGHRIELGEIETAVSSIEGISMNCCLYDEEQQKIVLFIDENYDRKYVKEKIETLVPEYMIPGKIIYLKEMPINANGKIDRIQLRRDFIDRNN